MARALAPDYELLDPTRVPTGEGERRLGVLRHRASGLLLHLLPGAAPARLGQPDGLPDEAPPHEVAVGPLLAGRAPVRQEEWDRVGGVPDRRRHEGADLPVGGVSWAAARAWLDRAGGGLRLPAEAEWEHACRAGTTTPFFWGERFDASWCWYLDNAERRPHEVAAHADRTNGFGLMDLAGNVSEWCAEDLDKPMEGSAWQEMNPGRVHRGGSFDKPSAYCRSSYRDGTDPRKAYPDLGLRAFRSVPLSSGEQLPHGERQARQDLRLQDVPGAVRPG